METTALNLFFPSCTFGSLFFFLNLYSFGFVRTAISHLLSGFASVPVCHEPWGRWEEREAPGPGGKWKLRESACLRQHFKVALWWKESLRSEQLFLKISSSKLIGQWGNSSGKCLSRGNFCLGVLACEFQVWIWTSVFHLASSKLYISSSDSVKDHSY